MKCTRCGEEATQIEQRDNNWWCLRCKLYVILPPDGAATEPALRHQFVEEDLDALRGFLNLRWAVHARVHAVINAVFCLVMMVGFAASFLNHRNSLGLAKFMVEQVEVASDSSPNVRAAVSEIESAGSRMEGVVGFGLVLLLIAGIMSVRDALRAGRQRRVAEILRSERGATFLERARTE